MFAGKPANRRTIISSVWCTPFEPMTTDGCLFKNEKRGVLLLLYVDDFILAARINNDIDCVADEISKLYELKRMGQTKTFLGYNMIPDLS